MIGQATDEHVLVDFRCSGSCDSGCVHSVSYQHNYGLGQEMETHVHMLHKNLNPSNQLLTLSSFGVDCGAVTSGRG